MNAVPRALLLFLLLVSCSATLAGQYAPAVAQWNQPVEPFRIIGNIYYVGASGVSAYLIVTPEGHILVDTGFSETVPFIESGMRKLGFRLEDIRIVLASHAHYDHAGGVADLQSRTKARVLLNPAEVDLFALGGKDDFAFGDKFPFPPVKGDGLLEDGGEVRLGGVAVKAHFTPGHTKGCTTYTATVREGSESYRVVMACSLSAPDYQLVGNPKYPGIVQDFESSFARLRALPCDVFLGGHGFEFGLEDKRKAAAGAGRNPFLDPEGYVRWIDRMEAQFRRQFERQREAAGGPRATRRRIAITLDDLPCAGPCRTADEATAVTDRILAALRKQAAPATGFVLGSRVETVAGEALLRQWLAAGITLGNHTYSHKDANAVSIEEFKTDVLRGEEVVRRARGEKPLRYFRFPFTHTGGSAEKKTALEEFLTSRGYEQAPFTIEQEDYTYNVAWLRARARNDKEMMKRIAGAYLNHLDASVLFAEGVSRRLFGREIPQILLMHANPLNAECLPAILESLKSRGYAFAALDEALADEAYRTPDRYTGAAGPSWLHRWGLALGKPSPMKGEPEAAEWLRQLAR